MTVSVEDVNYVRDDLAITGIRGTAENDTSDFDVVVSVCQDRRCDNIGTHYQHFPLADDKQSEWEWGGSCRYEVFERAANYVSSSLRSGESVLVHCHSGQNRSAAVIIAALGVVEGLDYYEAGEELYDARPIINVNQLMASHAKRYIHEKGDVRNS